MLEKFSFIFCVDVLPLSRVDRMERLGVDPFVLEHHLMLHQIHLPYILIQPRYHIDVKSVSAFIISLVHLCSLDAMRSIQLLKRQINKRR